MESNDIVNEMIQYIKKYGIRISPVQGRCKWLGKKLTHKMSYHIII